MMEEKPMKSRLLVVLALTVLLLAAFMPAPSHTQAKMITAITNTPTPAGHSRVSCPGALPSRLQVGQTGKVSLEPSIANRVRRGPSRDARVTGQLMPGEKFDVLEGPRCADGWAWWRVRSQAQDMEGWTSEGDEDTYWLEPLAAPTPTPTPTPAVRPNADGCLEPSDFLLSWWTGDGYANDLTGGNDGTLSSAAGYAGGIVGQAFRFNGKSSLSAPTTGLPTGDANRTLEFWVKVNSFHNGESLLVGYGKFGSSEQTYHLGTANRTLFFSQWGQALFGPDLETGRWYHVAVTNSGRAVSLYLDGKAVASGSLPINTPSGTQLYMGRLPGDPSKRLDGWIDEVSVYERALSGAQIMSIFQAGKQGKCIRQPDNLSVTPTPVVSSQGSAGPLAASFPLHLIGNAWSGILLGESTYKWGYLVDVTPLVSSQDGAHVETYIQTWFDGKKWVDSLFVSLPHPAISLDVQVDVYTTQKWSIAYQETLKIPAGNSQQFYLGAASEAAAYVLDVNPLKPAQAATTVIPSTLLPEFSDGTWWDMQPLAISGLVQPLDVKIIAYKAPGLPTTTFEMHLEPGAWQGIGLGPASQKQAYVLEVDPLSPGQEGFQLAKAVVQPEFDGTSWNDVLRVMIPQGQPALDVVVKVYAIKATASR
jgi:hypothetical protein